MIIYLILGLFFLLIFLVWISGFIFGAPFQSSSKKAIERMIRLSGVKKGEKAADIGSGTGRVVIEFAKKGAIVTGFEINPLLVWISRRRIKRLGLQKNATIKRQNFWTSDLSGFDVINIFQFGYIMGDIAQKLKEDIRKNRKRKRKKEVRVLSNTWRFPGRKPAKKDKNVFLYKF